MMTICVASRLLTRVTYIEDADSLRFALSVADRYDLVAMQPHFPGYPLFWALAKPLFAITGSFATAFALIGAGATLLLVVAGLTLLGERTTLRSPVGLAWAALVVCNPMVWLLGTRYMPDLLGAAVAIAVLALSLRAAQSEDMAMANVAALLVGLLAGVRLSYLPFVLVPMAWLILLRPKQRMRVLIVGTGGVLVWLIPMIAHTGWGPLLEAASRQTSGHFSDFGGTIVTESAPWPVRGWHTVQLIWADGLGGWLPGRHPLTVAVGLMIGAFLLAAIAEWRARKEPDPRRERVFRWLLGSCFVYGAWIVLYQNVLYKSRHVLPLLVVALLALAHGAGHLGRRSLGRVAVVAGMAAYISVGTLLALQHRAPSAIAQVVDDVRGMVLAQPGITVAAVPLVAYMLESQGIDASFERVDAPRDLEALRANLDDTSIVVSIGFELGGRQPDRSETFYHNPYVNRMWPAIPVHVYNLER